MKYTESQYGKFHYFNNDDIGRRVAAGEFHDGHLKPFIDALKPGDTMVDVGANFGFLTVYAARRGANVIAFEPAEALMELLRQNVKENRVEHQVIDFQIPLMSKVQWLRLNPAWAHEKDLNGIPDWEVLLNTGGFSLVPVKTGELQFVAQEHRFMSSTLDMFLFDSIQFIKVDAQGADLEVLRGAEKTIRTHNPKICFEFEPQDGNQNACGAKITDFVEFFGTMRYKVTQIHQGMTATDYVAEPAQVNEL